MSFFDLHYLTKKTNKLFTKVVRGTNEGLYDNPIFTCSIIYRQKNEAKILAMIKIINTKLFIFKVFYDTVFLQFTAFIII